MMEEAINRAQTGGRRKDIKRYIDMVERNSNHSSPANVSPAKRSKESIDFSNSYVNDRPKSKNISVEAPIIEEKPKSIINFIDKPPSTESQETKSHITEISKITQTEPTALQKKAL